MKKTLSSFLFLSAFLCLPLAALPLPGSLFIKGARVIDGTGSSPRNNTDIKIKNGVIVEVGENLSSDGLPVFDASTMTITPGLIDAHVHLRSVPGAIWRHDNLQEITRQQRLQLQAYVAAGVTTVLDTAAPQALRSEVEAHTSEGGAAPRLHVLAPFLTPRDGYFSSDDMRTTIYKDMWAPIESTSDIQKHMDLALAMSPTGIKVVVESGFGPYDVFETFTAEMRKNIVTEAANHQLPIFIHSMSLAEHTAALSMNPRALVHAGFTEETPTAEIIQQIKNSGTYVITTTSMYDMMLLMWNREALSTPLFQRLVPPKQLQTAKEDAATESAVDKIARQNAPKWAPNWLVNWLSDNYFNPKKIVKERDSSLKAIKMMYDAGIPIVVGSDSGNWPVFTSLFHGIGTLRELELLASAGIPPLEVIKCATLNAAKVMKAESEVGSISVGRKADLLILKKDPLAQMSSFRDPAYVMQNGVMRTPEEWMHAP